MNSFLRDLRLGVRTAFRSPSYSIVAVVTMALAIGANTLLFSLASPLVVRPLPIADPGSLGWIRQVNGPRAISNGRTSMPDFLDWRESARSFSSLAATENASGTLVGQGDARRVSLMRVTTNLPEVWGLVPHQGRFFHAGEDTMGRAPVGVLSHRFWRDAFNADPSVVNRTFSLDGQTLTIVGIMSPDIEIGNLALIDIWVPLPIDGSRARDARVLRVIGTLAPGATLESAGAEMKELATRLAKAHPTTNTDWEVTVLDSRSAMTSGDTWVILGLMGVVVFFVLLIACASLANLARARLVGRRQDLAVRQAMGASRVQLVRPLVSESLVLGVIGGSLGLLLAMSGLRVINAIAFEQFFKTLEIDRYVLFFNGALSVVTPLMFSLWPAVSQSRAANSETLRGGRIFGSRFGRQRGNFLIVSQVAMALSLLVVSALAVQSMLNFRRTSLGMDVNHLLTFKFDLPNDRYANDDARRAFVQRVTAELQAIPGARGAALASHLPVFDPEVTRTFTGTLNDGTPEGGHPYASWFAVTPAFFETCGMPLVAGRGLNEGDRAERQAVAVLSRVGATRYFNNPESAVGRTVQLSSGGSETTPVTIVGVVEGTKDSNLQDGTPQMFVPFEQTPGVALTAVVSADAPAARIADARAVLRRLDAGIALTAPKPFTQIVDEETSSTGIINFIFVSFAGLALLLAAAGLYGVISFTVGQRRQEFGVRLALGAAPSEIRSMVVGEGLKVTLIGVGLGLVLAWGLALASASVLFGVTPEDPWTYVGVTTTVLFVAVIAVWVPATRAMRVNPVTALRAD
jgi:putative ABC transport system permease protein